MSVEKLKNPFNSFSEIVKKINEIIDNIGGGGGGGFTPTQQQLDAMNSGATVAKINQIATNQANIQNVNTNKADKATTLSGYGITNAYTKTEVNTELAKKLTATGANRGLDITSNNVGHSNSITAPTPKRIIQGTYDVQGHLKEIETEFNWSNNYTNSAENQLFTRKGANDMYENYLKSTNGTLTKSTAITNDYSHYVKCGNIYQLSIGFQNTAEIAKDALLYTLPETISNKSIEMYIVISTTNGDTRILQCGGGSYSGNQIKAKAAIPAGYWFGNAILIKL